MKADAMATRMSVLTRALPTRILLVDDDELELELMAERLAAAGFETRQAANGEQALQILQQQWFPVVITDWQMPVMDGLALSQSLRTSGNADTYIIMLTTREANSDYERGYASGVDDYLTKKVQDTELLVRIRAAFNTLALRRSLKQAQEALEESVALDAASGVFTARETVTRLHAEISRAQRYGRSLSMITVGVALADAAGGSALPAELLRGTAATLTGVIRAHVDWVGRLANPSAENERGTSLVAPPIAFDRDKTKAGLLETSHGTPAAAAVFAVVLPEAGISDGPAIKHRLDVALARFTEQLSLPALRFSCGLVALERSGPGGPAVHVEEFLGVAERCRLCSGRVGTAQLVAVKQSVAGHVAIACRQGYAVADECPLVGERGQERSD